jgi:hypothetical protein
MSIHVCKCEHSGRTEYHLRYPGMTQDEAQALADRINGGELVGADHPVRKDAERYRWLRDNPWPPVLEADITLHRNARWDVEIDAAMQACGAVGAA